MNAAQPVSTAHLMWMKPLLAFAHVVLILFVARLLDRQGQQAAAKRKKLRQVTGLIHRIHRIDRAADRSGPSPSSQ